MDHDEGNSIKVDGEDADNLVYSLTYIFNKENNTDAFMNVVNTYFRKNLGYERVFGNRAA